MPRVAFVSTMEGDAWGGSEALWSQAALHLAKSGMAVGANVVHWPTFPQPLQLIVEAGGKVTRRPHPDLTTQKLARRLRGETSYRWLDTFSPDLVVISQGGNLDGITWMQECGRRGIPFVTIAQMANENYWPPEAIVKAAVEGYSKSRACFFVSHGNLELTQKQIAFHLPCAQVVCNPFQVSYNAAPPWPDASDAFKLACVGRLSPDAKGQDILLDVLGMDKWRQRAIQVTLYGNGHARETLAQIIRLNNLTNVCIGGYVNDVETIWAKNHALVLPSRYEGLPLAVVEAMLCGRISIVTDIAGNAELIEDDHTGYVAAAPHKRCLDEALERAWQNRDAWHIMGQAAAKSIRCQIPSDPGAKFAKQLAMLLTA